MKTTQNTAATIRSIIRWTTGAATSAAIMVAACSLFPLLSSFSAFSMTLCLALYAGLQIALPPVDEEDDWVPVRASIEEKKATEEATIVYFPSEIREAI